MESHPVPQNVTTFQFKLVGDMTLKQFMYLATGAIIAYILFVFAREKYAIIAWPLIVISAGLGAAFAFIPIQARPLDLWVVAFFKAVYTPTKRVWKKDKNTYKDDPLFKSRYLTYMTSLTPQPTVEEVTPPQSIKPLASLVEEDLPTHQQLKETVDLAKQAQNLQTKIIQTERQLNQIQAQMQGAQSIPLTYTQQINSMLSDLKNLISQASDIRQKLEKVENPKEETPSPPKIIEATKPQITIVIPQKHKQTQLALTTFPNVINGIVKDSSGNYLEGVVVVIYDKEGLPVRALKTNKLGQFTQSTPLPNGTYKVEQEKDGFNFDLLQIDLSGQVLTPIMITAKTVPSS